MPELTDNFAILGEERRPWIDPEPLKQKFLALSGETHPDRSHARPAEAAEAQARFTVLNTAYSCLREPRTRLRHFLELELGTKPPELQQIPPDLMNIFTHHGMLCREADEFLAKRARATSPLIKVQYWEAGQAIAEKLLAWQNQLHAALEKLITELKAADQSWVAGKGTWHGEERESLINQLSELYRLFSYYGRWTSQTQERIVQLSLD